ncbi:aldo/keto reductase [Marinivivus vitaminiproducens]|uniref:aldo/keto reductase n=1 Tax=Marinivivus vitaminiproducens TaxID=3035935 RepID=UPI0027992828|nr:aldo/keto reductase [Geminicoccaceae bacterium SCSIO 64248]
MEYVPLGRSGMMVSRYILGTLTFAGTNGFEALGSIDDGQGRRLVDLALDAGVNAIDTANLYSMGDAEKVVGHALEGRRDKVLLFSKARSAVGDGPNDGGASRVHLTEQIEASLRRLRTDHLDLYFVHQWDGVTPVEETVATVSDLVRAGKIRYWGISNYSGWHVAKTALVARMQGDVPPVAHQIYYTPEAREAEYEIIPANEDFGIGSMIWSPLGQGLLTGKVTRDAPPAEGTRQSHDWPEPWVTDRDRLYRVIDALKAVADEHGVSVAQVTLAWVRQRPGVGTVVLGARNEDQLKDNLASAGLVLSAEQMGRIEAAGQPAAIYPFWHRSMWGLDRPTPIEKGYLEAMRASMRS